MKRKITTPDRKDKAYWKKRRNLLTLEDFKRDVAQIFDLDHLLVKIYNNNFARMQNKYILKSQYADEIRRLRSIENSSDGDKKEVQRLIKLALIETLNEENSWKEDRITVDKSNVNEIIKELAEQHNLDDLSLKAMEPVKELLISRATWYMEDHYPIYFWLTSIKGIGEKTAAKLISIIVDIRRFNKPSQLLSYFGAGDMERSKKRKGVQLNYNPAAKSLLLGIIAENLVKLTSQYKVVYDKRKAFTTVNRPDWSPGRRNNDARRVMAKRFMVELWDAWYRSLGMEPPAQPYGVEIQGHHREKQIVEYKPL